MCRVYTLNSFNINQYVVRTQDGHFLPETNISRFAGSVIRQVGLQLKVEGAKLHCHGVLWVITCYPIHTARFTHLMTTSDQVITSYILYWSPSTVSGSSRPWCHKRRGKGTTGCSRSAPAGRSRGSRASCQRFLSELPSLLYRWRCQKPQRYGPCRQTATRWRHRWSRPRGHTSSTIATR